MVTGLAWLCLVITASASPKARDKVPLMVLSGALAVIGLALKTPGLRLALSEGAALLALLLVWRSSQSRVASQAYLVAVLISAAAVIGGSLRLNTGSSTWAAALLFAGFALKLGLVPLYLWLPQVAEATPAPVAALVVSVIDVSAFGDLWLLKTSGSLPANSSLWLALAVLSALGGALLMLAQHDLKRLLAFSSIEDMGFLVLGVFSAGQWGLAGALTGVMVHALAKALLFTSLTAPEAEGPVNFEQRGMASRYPLAGVGFLVGMLAILGIPPLWGFAAHWRLYASAAEISPLLLFAFLLASAMALLAYVRALAIFWWGASNNTIQKPPVRSLALNSVLLVLILILFIGGLWPEIISALSRLLGG
jgi:multicomponent Na+:H+ antiporter subunit D